MSERGSLSTTATRFVGRSVPRLEDGPLVTGSGAFANDVSFPHQLHMRVVRSAHAHGRILAIDASAARALPGVAAVWTWETVWPSSESRSFSPLAAHAECA